MHHTELLKHISTRSEVTSDQYVCQQVCGEYKHLPIAGHVVMDAGANIGAFTAYAVLNGAAKVISYEPDPENFRMLKLNCGKYPNVTLNEACLSNGLGSYAEFYLTNGKSRDGFSIIPFAGRRPITVVNMNFQQQLDAHRPSCIKMDVESAEFELLSQPLPDFVKHLVVEIHFAKASARQRFGELVKMFENWNCIIEPKCGPKNWHTLAQYSR